MSDSCEPMDCSLPGSSVHGIFQARILEWVAFFFSKGLILEKTLMLRRADIRKDTDVEKDRR